MSQIKKFYLILGLSVLILLGLFSWQIKRTLNINVKHTETPIVSTEIYNVPTDESETLRGNPGATTILVEFLDLNCSDCAKTYTAINKFVDTNPTKVKLFLKTADTSGLFSHNTKFADIAAYCASQQKRYRDFMDSLMAQSDRWSESSLTTAANEAKLNINSWSACRESENASSFVEQNLQLAKILNINVSPTIFVNNKKIDPTTKIDITEILQKFIP